MTGTEMNYAQALYSLAQEDGNEEQILQQLEALAVSYREEPDFLRLLDTPDISKEERCKILDDCFREKVHPYVLNFMKILTEKGYIRRFCDCCKAYREIFNEAHGILSVVATTAVEMTTQQKEKLRTKLETITGKTVLLQTRLEESCVGGVRLDYDGKRIDGTVKSRLEDIRSQLFESR